MYKYQVNKYILSGIMITLWLCSYVLWFDLTNEIFDKFKTIYGSWYADDGYLDVPYDPTYSKDPFWDAMKVYELMSLQTKVAWVKYVQNALDSNGCSLSKEKQWAILYHFVPEFRSEIARDLKLNNDPDSKNYVFDDNIILEYCTEFYNCIINESDLEDSETGGTITSGTPEEIKTNCKEFFQAHYGEGQIEEKRIQNLQISWLWNDKYLNAIVKESPFDVMGDVGTIWELSYLQAQMPITPVFYDLSVFSDSKEALTQRKNWWGDDEELVYRGSVSFDETEYDASLNTTNLNQTRTNSNPSVQPLSPAKVLTIEWYDSMVEGLWGLRLNNDNSVYYWSLCKDAEEEPEVESIKEEKTSVSGGGDTWRDISDLTNEEYQELVKYMYEAVDSYTSLSDEKLKEIEDKVWSLDFPDTADSIEEAAKDILWCYKSCEWLSVDAQFLCILKCSCKETKSPIFDPEVTPGMWPIYVIRYCAVASANPRYVYEWTVGTDSWSSTMKTSWWASSTKKWSSWKWKGSKWWWNWWSEWWKQASKESIWTSFNKGWITMVSMEKWINEILWVTDKLSREWRLWVRTPQRNHLDSSTDLMNAYDTFSFTINANSKKVSDQVWEPTDEYMQRYMKTRDESRMVANHVANPLDNPATKNRFRLVNYQWEIVSDISASANADQIREAEWYLDVAPSFVVDQSENSNMVRYAKISELFGDWLDEQWDFWAKKVEYLEEMDSYAKALYAKKW